MRTGPLIFVIPDSIRNYLSFSILLSKYHISVSLSILRTK
jgi:hypothetical protein